MLIGNFNRQIARQCTGITIIIFTMYIFYGQLHHQVFCLVQFNFILIKLKTQLAQFIRKVGNGSFLGTNSIRLLQAWS